MKRSEADQFFNTVSLLSGMGDIRTIRTVYYGIVKAVSSGLLKGFPVELPEFGTFKIVIKKEHEGVNISTGEKVLKKRSALLRFKPCRAIKMWCQTAKFDQFL